jgi:hypothetical protein
LADADKWFNFTGTHSSCCGVLWLAAVKNPRSLTSKDHPAFCSGETWPDYYYSADRSPYTPGNTWDFSRFSFTEYREGIWEIPKGFFGPWTKYHKEPQAGMIVMRVIGPNDPTPEGYTVYGSCPSGKVVGRRNG